MHTRESVHSIVSLVLALLCCAGGSALLFGCTGLPIDGGPQSVTGDLNGDGVVTQADLDLMVAAFGQRQGDPLYTTQADLNGDGIIGQADIQALTAILAK